MKGQLRTSLGLFLRTTSAFSRAGQVRFLHKSKPAPPVPAPRPFVPDVQTFLTLIGRNLSRYSSKFPSWDALFSLTSDEMRELGIEPARDRKYLLTWMDRYRKGALGPGGDFKFVKDGEAILKIASPHASPFKVPVNVPHPEAGEAEQVSEVVRPLGYRVSGLKTIVGPSARQLPGQDAVVVKVREGMWEHRRGRKIDGGERRQAEIRFKKRSAERRAEREAEMAHM